VKNRRAPVALAVQYRGQNKSEGRAVDVVVDALVVGVVADECWIGSAGSSVAAA